MASNANALKDTVVPRFFRAAVENPFKTKKEGRPIFDDVEMVETIIPGDRLTKPTFVVTDDHKVRWPKEYEAFKRGEALAASGTPLEHWPIMTTSRVMEMKAIGILSVDMLAAVSDANLAALGTGSRELREQARAFIAAAKDGAATAAQAKEIEDLKAQVLRLQDQLLVKDRQPADDERNIEDLSDQELKTYIKRETGESVKGNPSRDTLLSRVTEIATKKAA